MDETGEPECSGPGRPAYSPTKAARQTVERMCSVGDSHETIARAIGIDAKTLRKHFTSELLTGAARQRRKVVEMVYRGAMKGNATLIKRLEEMTRSAAAVMDPDEMPEAVPSTRRSKLGKKETQREEALVAGQGNEWGDDLAPLSDRLN